MKNQQEKHLLSYLTRECKNSGYSVIDKKDVLSSFDKKIHVDEIELETLMSSLERQSFIKIKYEDENVYCLCVLKHEIEEKKESSKKSLFPSFLLSLAGAFLGSFFATLIVRLIFNI